VHTSGYQNATDCVEIKRGILFSFTLHMRRKTVSHLVSVYLLPSYFHITQCLHYLPSDVITVSVAFFWVVTPCGYERFGGTCCLLHSGLKHFLWLSLILRPSVSTAERTSCFAICSYAVSVGEYSDFSDDIIRNSSQPRVHFQNYCNQIKKTICSVKLSRRNTWPTVIIPNIYGSCLSVQLPTIWTWWHPGK
jgi:hypothetical protein